MKTFNSPQEAYDWLRDHSRETANLESASAVLHWDQRTMIPPKAHEHRAEVLAQLAGMMHEREISPLRGAALEYLEATPVNTDPLSEQGVNVRQWRRDYDRKVKIPQSLAVELARTASLSETAWEQARPNNDWTGFLPHLERILELKRQEAEAVGYETEPYDALLDEYEQDERAANLEPMFHTLRQACVDLLRRIREAPVKPDPDILSGAFPVEEQRAFALEVAQAFGYDLQAGRLDVTAHPFSITLGPYDSRITTRFRQDHFSEAFFGVAHETGHALYEQGLVPQHWGTPMGQAVSLGVHESQSRLWENTVARSAAFWNHFLPMARRRFASLQNVAQDDFVLAVNTVAPGCIRTDADEVTYNLHVLLRFELELDLFRGRLLPKDLPEAWNAKMRDLLDITPPKAADGVLQDVHWAAGLIGYFPTYTLGNVYAAQFFHAAEKALGPQEAAFSRGDFAPLLSWLRENVHAHGRRFAPRELVRRATGGDVDTAFLISALEEKYSRLFQL